MAELRTLSAELDHKFDQKTNRHYVNNKVFVLHCHHYSTLYCQLALDAGETELLESVCEESFYESLKEYFVKKEITLVDERILIACQLYGAYGLGKMEVGFIGPNAGEVILHRSHVDEGWIKKWGKFDKSVNCIGVGYVRGMFSAILDKPIGTYFAMETESIVKGANKTKIKVLKK